MIAKRSEIECRKLLRAYDETGKELTEQDIRNQATFKILDILPLERKKKGILAEVYNTMKSRLYFPALTRVIQYRETKETIKITIETYHNE